ncbi:MAG: FtsX-like permease family protein [Verrucomicrobiota bacterium]
MAMQRTRRLEFWLAIGAQPRSVLALVVGQGMRLTLLGIVLGAAGAFALTPAMRRLLYEVAPTDALTFTLAPLILALVALSACWLPAWRASRLDPTRALRFE